MFSDILLNLNQGARAAELPKKFRSLVQAVRTTGQDGARR